MAKVAGVPGSSWTGRDVWLARIAAVRILNDRWFASLGQVRLAVPRRELGRTTTGCGFQRPGWMIRGFPWEWEAGDAEPGVQMDAGPVPEPEPGVQI